MKALSSLVNFVKNEPKKALIRFSVGAMIITFSTWVSIALSRTQEGTNIKNEKWQKETEKKLLDLSRETGATQQHPGMKILPDGSILVITVDKNNQIHGIRHFWSEIHTNLPNNTASILTEPSVKE